MLRRSPRAPTPTAPARRRTRGHCGPRYAAHASRDIARFGDAVDRILAEPYQPAYVPLGFDDAFAPALVPNTAPAQEYTTGSIPESPDHPAWPAAFEETLVMSGDGAPLLARSMRKTGIRSRGSRSREDP